MNIANSWNILRYSLYTPFYDLVAGIFAPYRAKSIAHITFKGDDQVLIVGAGTGLDLKYFPADVRITATDITPSMLLLLKQRAKKRQQPVLVKQMDGQHLTLPDNSVDVVVLHLILAVIPDPVACLRECERVLKQGGQLVIFDKFMAPSQKTTLARKIAGSITDVLFSDINRKIEPIVASTQLRFLQNEAAAFGGLFRYIKLQKDQDFADMR